MFGGPMRDTVASAHSLTPHCVSPLTRNIWPVDRTPTEPKRVCCTQKCTVQVLRWIPRNVICRHI
jgi:hypothetical protein